MCEEFGFGVDVEDVSFVIGKDVWLGFKFF